MRNSLSHELGWTDVRIDRTSILGNPYEFKDERHRDLSIEAYRRWLWECFKDENKNEIVNPTLFLVDGITISSKWKKTTSQNIINELERITKLDKVRLLCWCVPASCHGNVLEKCLKWLYQK